MKTQTPTLVSLQVLRAFWMDGAVQPVGSVVQVAAGLAADLLNARKVCLAPEPLQAEAQAITDNTPKSAAPARRRSNA